MSKHTKLAILGGKPLPAPKRIQRVFHFKDEISALKEALAGPALALGGGKYVMRYRQEIAKIYGVKNVVTTNSGSSALHVALAAAGVAPGDEVILSPMTDFGSIAGIFQLNAIPVFCDVVPGGIVMDADRLEEYITPRTKVIMPIHNGGYPVDMHKVMRIAKKHKILVVEDCAQAHLTRIGKKYAGTFGDFGCFSTNESKHMKSGEGGFILCKNKDQAKYADLFADKGYERFPVKRANPGIPAMNLRLSEIHATIGYQQIRKCAGWVKKRNNAGVKMEKLMEGLPLIKHDQPKNAFCSYWWNAFYLDTTKTRLSTERFIKAANHEHLPCRNGLQMIAPTWEIFRKLNKNPKHYPQYIPGRLKKGFYRLDKWPQAKWAAQNIMCVNIDQYTTPEEVVHFGQVIEKIFANEKELLKAKLK